MVNLIFLVVTGFFSNVGLLVLLPILSVLDGMDEMPSSIGLRVQKAFDWLDVQPTLAICLGIFLVIMIANTFLHYFQSTTTSRLNTGFVAKLRTDVFSKVTWANYQFHLENPRSSLTHILTQEVQRVSGLTHFFLRQVSSSILALTYFLFSLFVSVSMTLVATSVAILFYGLLRFQNKSATEAGQVNYNLSQHLFHVVTDSLAAIDITKVFSGERRHIKEVRACSEDMANRQQGFQRLQAKNKVVHKLGGAIFLAAYFYTAHLFDLPMANTLLLLVLFSRLFPLASQLQQNYQNILQSLPAFSAVMELLDLAQDAREIDTPATVQENALRGALSLHGISYSYPSKQIPALRSLDFELLQNKTTALIGPSGGGKSTLSKIVVGLLEPTQGEIRIGLHAQDKLKMMHLRRSVAYVPQDDFLFNDTVEHNLLWAHPNAGMDEVHEAIAMAAAEFIHDLPKGLQTVVGDRGVKLSGGERQRIAIARALLKRPSILVLDEATSFLDLENERRFQASLVRLKGKLTILVIAHRLTTIQDADIIYALNSGEVSDKGSWQELHGPGRYFSSIPLKNLEQKGQYTAPLRHGWPDKSKPLPALA